MRSTQFSGIWWTVGRETKAATQTSTFPISCYPFTIVYSQDIFTKIYMQTFKKSTHLGQF